MSFYWLVLGILGVWRVVHLLNAEDGPWDLVTRLRRSVSDGWGEVLDCFYCLSLWVAAPFGWLIGVTWSERLLLWLAMSAGASLLEQATSRHEQVPPAIYTEEKENGDVLWQESDAVARRDS